MNQTSEVRAFNKFTGTGGREPKNSANSALKWCLPRHGHIIKGKENSYTGKPYQSLLVFSIKTLSTQKNEKYELLYQEDIWRTGDYHDL